MLYITHLMFAFVLSLLTLLFIDANIAFFVLIALFAALLPDIDTDSSKLGKRAKIFSMFFQHRGFFHSLTALLLFSFIFFYAFKEFNYTIAFVIGYGSHLLLDMLNISGIALFYPLSSYRIKGFFRTSQLFEFMLIVLLSVVIFYLVKYFLSF